METIRAILVDDEESARNILSNLLRRVCPEVTLLGTFENVPAALEGIQQLQPDLVFLDIEMPNYAGYEIVNFFDEITFDIIFVTAYDQYAIKAFEISAVDYLLKPIEIDRLKEAVRRVKEKRNVSEQNERLMHLKQALRDDLSSIIVHEKGLQHVLPLEQIVAIEAQESYSHIHTLNKRFVASKNLKHFENLLSDQSSFIRVHKSWLINREHMINYSRSSLEINLRNNIVAKLSKYKKADFELVLSRNTL